MSEYDTTLRINQILWDGASIEAAMRIERICWMRPDDDFIGLINIKDLNANPRIDSLKKIKELVTENALQTSSSDQIVISPLLSTDIGDKYFARAKELYDLFTPFFHENQVELFTEGMRYRVIKKNRVTLQVGLNTVLKYLRRYYQKGMTLDAFVPEYAKCGGAGKERRSIKKLGRPVSPENIGGYSDGMPLSKKDKENLKKGWKKFAGVKKETFQGAYEKTLKEFFFHEIRVLPNGKIERVIDPEKPIPSFTQFTYWGTKKLSKKAIRLKKSSEIEIELNHKPIMNSSRVKEGPGTQYQVDGTGGLVYLVAPWDETKIIGKAQIYGVQDNYSQLVVGWSVVIDNASYATLMLALECAFTDKDDLPADLNEELCERLGLPCGSPLMPKGVVCDELLGDGGPELVGEQSSRLVERGLFSWATAKPRAANWKAYIERFFGHLKAKLNQIPGAADRYRKRGVKAPSELACLTPSEFKSLIIQAIIQYNHSYTVKDHPDAISLARAGYDCCTPINLWEWGSRHRSGSGRSYPKTFIRSVLLPRVDASISSKGIKANNLYYISESVNQLHGFHRGLKQKTNRIQVAFDPRDVSAIWLINEDGSLGEVCLLTPANQHFTGQSLWDVNSYFKEETAFISKSRKRGLSKSISIDDAMDSIISAAVARRNMASEKPSFDQDSRDNYQQEERHHNKWSNEITGSPKLEKCDPDTSPFDTAESYFFGE